MSEKRFRPTLGQYRALESKVEELTEQVRLLEKANGYSAEEIRAMEGYRQKYEEQLEGTSNLVADCNAWRVKFRELQKKYEEQIEGTSHLVADCDAWRENFRDLEKELEKTRETNIAVGKQCSRLNDELNALRSRGFWARVFNKEG